MVDSVARGRALRSGTPRSAHRRLPDTTRDPVELLQHQARSRVPELLLPIRRLAELVPQTKLMVDQLGSIRRLVRQLGMLPQPLVRGDAPAGDPVAALVGQDGIEETFGQAIGLVR